MYGTFVGHTIAAAATRSRRSNVGVRLRDLFELPGADSRLSAMEGMRGLAIVLVFFAHVQALIAPAFSLKGSALSVVNIVGGFGTAGVDVFFMLSGFLIYRSALRRDLNFRTFYLRRVERIYPTFAVVLAAYYFFAVAHIMPFRGPHALLPAIGYVFANATFLPGVFDIEATINAAWSLSYEWAFYLAIPFAVRALRIYNWMPKRRIGYFVFAAVAYIGFCIAVPQVFPYYKWWDSSLVRMAMFLCGMSVYEILNLEDSVFRSLLARQRTLVTITVAMVVAVVIFETFASAGSRDVHYAQWIRLRAIRAAGLFVLSGCLALSALSRRGILGKMFRTTWVRWTGNMSYSFYLSHAVSLHIFAGILIKVPVFQRFGFAGLLVVIPFAFAFCYIVSGILFALVEKPFSLQPKRVTATATVAMTAP